MRFDIDAYSFGVFEDEAAKIGKHRTSKNLGVPPALWRSAGKTQQAKLIEQFKRENRGVYHPDYLRVNLSLLRQIGVEPPVDEPFPAMPASDGARQEDWVNYSVFISGGGTPRLQNDSRPLAAGTTHDGLRCSSG